MNKDDRGEAGTLIVKNPILRDGFTQIPNAVLRDAELSSAARLTYGLLLSCQWTEPGVFPGRQRMATELGASVDSIDRCLNALRDRGLISWKRRGNGMTNVYIIHELPYRKIADRCLENRESESAPAPTLNGQRESAPVRLKQYSIESRKEQESPPLPPQGGAGGNAHRKTPDLKGFDEWYALYPRHIARGDAERAWAKLETDVRQAALDAIRLQLAWPIFTEREIEKIPYPASWLNSRQWEDEPPQINSNRRQPARRRMTDAEWEKL